MSAAAEKVRERIRKLRDRKVGRGFTEAEALQAAEVAAALMRDHGLTEDDIVMDRRESRNRGGAGTIRAQLWAGVATNTNCAAIFGRDLAGDRIVWIGRAPGPEIAVYLHAMLTHAVNRELADFRKTTFYRRRRSAKTKSQAAEEFTYGLVHRLRRRLYEMFAATRSEEAREAASEALDRAFPDSQTVKPKKVSERFQEARDAGWSAGGRVGLHRGVGADEGPAGSIEAPRLLLRWPE